MGDQNQGKTELGRALFGHDFYGDGLSSKLDVDDVTLMARCWGVELGELNGITRRTQAEKLKAFLSRRVDLVRRKYASTTEPVPRRSVFWATTNKSPLSDSSGSTRFVMIPLGSTKLPIERVWQHRDSIWKRAYQEYRNHTQWYSTEEEMAEIISRNGDYDLVDPWSEPIGHYLRSHSGAAYIQHSDIYQHLGIDPERQHGGNARRITELMEAHGWKHGRKRIAGTKVRAFFPDQVDRATH